MKPLAKAIIPDLTTRNASRPSKNIQAEGPSRDYETKVCTLYRINPALNGKDELRLDPYGEPCPSDGSNYAR